MSTSQNHNHNNNQSKDGPQQPRISKEIPLLNASSRSVQYLQNICLFPQCFTNEVTFKQMIGHLILSVCKTPQNASLILNLSIPLSMHRSVMMEKFRKLDHILGIVIKPLDIRTALKTRYKNCHYKDIVAHYTRYQFVIQQNNDSESDNNTICGRFIRGNVLGNNGNLNQFLCAIRDHLGCDHSQFLTVSAPQISTADLDLLCCRYFCICEALITFNFGNEIIVDESRYYRQILDYFIKFVSYCFEVHNHPSFEFNGLSNDHLKMLIAGTVLLEFGLKKRRPIKRLALNMNGINKAMNKLLETKLRQLKEADFGRNCFKLTNQTVAMTEGSKNEYFRKDIDKYFEQIYQLFKDFLMNKQ